MFSTSFFNTSVAKNTLSLGLMQLANYIAPLIILLHLVNVLGLETYGLVAISFSIVIFSWVVMDLGHSLSLTQEISKTRSNKKYVNELVSAAIILKVIVFMPFAIALISLLSLQEAYRANISFFIFTLIPIFFQGLVPIWFFHGMEKMKYFAACSVFAKFSSMILILIYIQTEQDYIFIPFLTGAGQFFSFVISIFFFYKLGNKLIMPSKKVFKFVLSNIRGFYESRLAVSLYSSAPIIVLGATSSQLIVGIYALAEQAYKILQTIVQPLAQSLYPYMASNKDGKIYLKNLVKFIIPLLIFTAISFFITPIIFLYFFGEQASESIILIKYFHFIYLFHVANLFLGYPFLVSINKLDTANNSVQVALLGFAIFIFFLLSVGKINIFSIASSLLIAELISLIIRLNAALNFLKKS